MFIVLYKNSGGNVKGGVFEGKIHIKVLNLKLL